MRIATRQKKTLIPYQDNFPDVTAAQWKLAQHVGLTEAETVALSGWSGADYAFVNPIAWGNDEVHKPSGCKLYKAEVLPYIEVLDSALDKLPPVLPLNRKLWRGSMQSAKELGNLITGGFSSTSYDIDQALMFIGKSLWVIESHTSGKDITKFAAIPDEEEVLFPAGSRLKVVECSSTAISDSDKQKIDNFSARELDKYPDIICMREVPASKGMVV